MWRLRILSQVARKSPDQAILDIKDIYFCLPDGLLLTYDVWKSLKKYSKVVKIC